MRYSRYASLISIHVLLLIRCATSLAETNSAVEVDFGDYLPHHSGGTNDNWFASEHRSCCGPTTGPRSILGTRNDQWLSSKDKPQVPTSCNSLGSSGYCQDTALTSLRCRQPDKRWYAVGMGLFLDRSEPRRIWTTYENNNNANQLMNTQHATTDWQGGADIRIGRCFDCNRGALELGYWSVGSFSGSASQNHTSFVSSPLLFNDLEFGAADPVADYFDSAEEHRLRRTNELHNIELNLMQGLSQGGACNRWAYRMMVGVRYFKFDEELSLSTLDQGGTWGGNGGLNEVVLRSSTSNDLVGVQVGCSCERQISCRTRFFATPKFGVYNNRIEHQFDLRRGDGTAAMPSATSGITGTYPVDTSNDVIAFLSEINVGLQYQLGCRWSLSGGYRTVVLSQIGLADNQIPQYIIDIPEIADINSDASLILHGAFFGITRVF